MLRDFSKESFDIIIQAGQSNAEGYAFGDVDNPYEQNNRVYYLNGDFSISEAAERVAGNGVQSNFSLSFAREYMKAGYLKEGRSLLIIRAAVGGTGFIDGHWKTEDELYIRMINMTKTALELNPDNRLIALLWHQGESDADFEVPIQSELHYKHFSTLVKSVKETFNVPDLPFVAGDFVHHWKNANIEKCIPVVDAMRAVCHDLSCGGFVETDGLLSNLQETPVHPLGWEGDSVHFSRHAIYELGVRYFEAYEKIVQR